MEKQGKALRERVLSTKLQQEFVTFVEYAPAARLSRNLRKMFMDYLAAQHVGLPVEFDDMLSDLYWLFHLLDVLEDELGKRFEQGFDPIHPEDICDEKKDGIKQITDLVVATVQPEMIFRVIHPYAELAEPEYVDLLIVVSDKCQTPFAELEPLMEFITLKDNRFSYSLHKSSQIVQALTNGHVYFSLICTTTNLIYSDGTQNLPAIPIEHFTEIVSKATGEFEAGMIKAKNFYAGANFHHEAKEPAMAMFMLQQATELTFRAVALSLYGMDRRTHSIKSLKKLNKRLAPQLNAIFPADTEYEAYLLKLHEDAYLDARYAADFTVKEEDLQELLSRVERLVDVAQSVFHERIKVFDIGE